ncbi:MAG: response regulator [Planctomycetota bacterium]
MAQSSNSSSQPSETVYIIDDDPLVLEAVDEVLRSRGFETQTFESADDLFGSLGQTDTGVVVTDLQMPGMNGLEVQQEMLRRGMDLSFILLTGYADVPVTVEVMRNGAVSLVEKPFRVDHLVAEVQRGLDASLERNRERSQIRQAREAIARLDDEELAVLDCAARGKANKTISYELCLSARTVDRRRQSAFRKLQIESVAEFAILRAVAQDPQRILSA